MKLGNFFQEGDLIFQYYFRTAAVLYFRLNIYPGSGERLSLLTRFSTPAHSTERKSNRDPRGLEMAAAALQSLPAFPSYIFVSNYVTALWLTKQKQRRYSTRHGWGLPRLAYQHATRAILVSSSAGTSS